MDKKVHYKMHKVKKQWVTIAVTGMSLGAVSAVSLGTNDGVVQADEHTDATVAIPDISVDTGTVSNDTTTAQDPTTAVATTNNAATDQVAPTATFDLTTDTTNTVVANAVDTAATVGTDRAATTTDTTATNDTAVDTTNNNTTTDTTTVTDRAATRERRATGARRGPTGGRRATPVAGNNNNANNGNNTVTVVNNDLPAANNVVTDGPSHIKTINGKQYYVEDDGTIRKNYVLERNGGSQYFNAETGELSNQKEYRFDKNGGTGSSADSTNTNVTVNGDKNAFYGTTDKDIELVDGYFTANTWYRPKEILKDGKEWTASTENDKRPLLTVWWPSKTIQASYLNYMKEQGLGTNQTYSAVSSQSQMDQAALEVQKRIEERIAREGNTDWLRTTIKNFVKTQPGWNSTSENLDNSDHLQGGALLYNNDSRTSQANSDYRLLNRRI